jgi:hypothetical protein
MGSGSGQSNRSIPQPGLGINVDNVDKSVNNSGTSLCRFSRPERPDITGFLHLLYQSGQTGLWQILAQGPCRWGILSIGLSQ